MKYSKVTELITLAKTQFLSFYEAKYINRVGKPKTWIIASRKNEEVLKEKFFDNKKDVEDAVVIAALHKPSNKLVIIKQFRVPVNEYVYELTAGLIDEGETSKTTIARELKEETGLDVVDVISEGKRLYLSPGMTDESVNLVYCTCEGEISDKYLEDDECIEAVMISRDEAKKILESNECMDIKCYLILQSFVTLGERLFEKNL